MLWPVYEFRPLPEQLRGRVRRYADGQWVDDDGEHDLAFAVTGGGAPMVYYLRLPYSENILWSWTTGHWSGTEPLHPRGNPWHYMLREGASERGRRWERDKHPNLVVGDLGMSMVAAEQSCANGGGPEFNIKDPYIRAGLVRDRETKEVLTTPESPICMYCGPLTK